MQSLTKRKLSGAKSLSRKGSRSKLPNVNEERPIPFIVINKRASGKNNVKFTVTEEAKTFLSEITGPIAVVTVTGLYRTGKSYLINQMLLNRKDGFNVGGSVNACTKGIWIWSKPLKGYTQEGKPIQILIMDTEGLGSLDEDNNHDMRVFSLALLLSSTFIYNSVGNIDEGALQSLNLLVGLTKNIQVKAAQSNQNMFKRINSTENQQQFSQFFPNFLWVVRDFSLQLVDSNNDPISSKQYLESALLLQKGTSEAAQQKNRIRRALSQFFPDRDCVCMVRPLTDQGNLQSLEQLQIQDLRPQFVEQITQLRRKVLNRGKVKQMFGKPVHGAVLAGLSEAYVDAINQGAVPNIENAWTYVCQAQAMKGYKAAIDYMNRQIESEEVMGSLPMDENQLNDILKNIKTEMIKIFRNISLEGQEFENKLINGFKKEKQRILEENRERSNKILKQFLQSAYSQKIERNLQNYETFLQFQEDLRIFQKEVRKQLPKVAGKQEYIAQFMKNKSIESADFICQKISNQVQVQRRLSEESNQKLQKELEELRQDTGRERALLRGKVSNLQNEKAQVIAREQCLRENLNTCIKEKQAFESKVNDELDTQQKENVRLQQEYNLKLQSSDENAKEQQRQIKRIESEYQNHQALLEQKITFLEKCREEGIKKEKESADDLINTKREHQLHVKELNNRFDKQLKSLQNKLDQSQQKINELETSLMKYEQKFEIQGQQWKTREQRILNDVSDLESDIKLLTDKNQKLHQQHAESMNKLAAEKEEIFQKYQKRIQDTQEQVKQLDEQHYQKSNNWQKDVAMKKQKIEFLQLQVKELTQQLSEQKRANQAVLKTIHEKELENAAGKEQADKKTFQIIERHKLEVNQLKLEYDSMNERMNEQLKELSNKNGELQLQMKLIETDSLREATLLKDQLGESERQRIAATDKLKALDAQKVQVKLLLMHNFIRNLLEQNDRNHKQTLDSLQKVIQDKDKRSAKELQDASKRYQTSIEQLRILHSQEKERLQARIQEERSKNKRLSDQQADELEQRLAEERRVREEQMDLLQMQSQQSLMESQSLINQLQNELKLRQQKIQTLESYLKQTKDSLNKIQQMNNSSLQSQLEKFNQERRDLVDKIEGMTRNIAEKEKKISEMESKLQNAAEMGTIKEKELQIQLNDLKNEKGDLLIKMEGQRDRCKKAEDQLMSVKVQINKELALKAQEVQFLTGKLEESKREKDAMVNRYEEKIRQLREQYQLNKSVQIQHLQKTNKMLELRLQQKIKSNREEQQSSRQRISQLQTQKDKIRGNLQKLEVQFLQQKNTYEKQLKILRDRLDDPEDASMAVNQHQKEKAKLQLQISNLQRDNQELQNSLSTKQSLLEKKQAYFQQERENGKKHQKTMQDQYLITIEKLKDKLKREKSGHDSQKTTATLTKMEQRYRQKIRQMGDQQQKICKDLLSKNQILDQHIANLKISNQQQIQNKECIIGELERKLDEQSLDLQNLELQLNEWRSHSAELEHIHKLQVQLENQTVRAESLQNQLHESQHKRQQMMFNHAKQQAKSSLEKDQLIYMKNQLQQVNERLQQKKQDLLNQIETLRMNRAFSPNKSTRSFISPDRRSGILTTSSSNSNLNLPLKLSANHTSNHKYSIQPSKHGQNYTLQSQYLSPHSTQQQQILNFSGNNLLPMTGKRTSSSRSPHVKTLSMTQYHSPSKTLRRSPIESKFATVSDQVTVVGDNDQDPSFVLPGYQQQAQNCQQALLTNKLHQEYPKQMMHSHHHHNSHNSHHLHHHHKVNSGSSSSANLNPSSSTITLRRSPSSITTAVNLNQN